MRWGPAFDHTARHFQLIGADYSIATVGTALGYDMSEDDDEYLHAEPDDITARLQHIIAE